MSNCETLAFEIGTEEIPAFDLHKATEQLATLVPQALDNARIPHGEVHIYSTPRRLMMIVDDVALETEALDEVFKGPAVRIAFDEEGKPTKAAEGFARGKGVDVADLEVREENGVAYVFATRSLAAVSTLDLLPDVLRSIITGISWAKSCRWGTTNEYFSRPVRWLVALLGQHVIPVEFAGLTAGNLTRGHRFLSPGPHEVPSASELLQVVESAYVVTSEQARESIIREGVAAAEKTYNSRSELPAKTLLEVTNLCEFPTVLVGTFDEEFLDVPEEIIVDAMLMHQRYFPLYDEEGKLTNRFIVVSNGDPACADTIIAGNEKVVRARLSDAKFFYEEDLKNPLEAYVDHLDEVVFQESLGTMKAKTNRIVALAEHLAEDAGLCDVDAADARRAAYLAKADLVTNAVIEFTSVQGIMGSYYAAAAGETPAVAQAVGDHYRPRFSGDEPPASVVGQVVAMADKLDTICGLFAVGQGPTGSSDPFALRRSALGIIAMLQGGLPVSLSDAIDASLATYEDAGVAFEKEAIRSEVIDFFVTRTKVLLRDEGAAPDAIDAIIAAGVVEPAEIIRRVRSLEEARRQASEDFADLAIAFARANNLRDAAAGTDYNASLLSESETALADAVKRVSVTVEEALGRVGGFEEALGALATLRAPIDTFFETTMVMDEDLALRANRMKLLNAFAAPFAPVADFSLLVKTTK